MGLFNNSLENVNEKHYNKMKCDLKPKDGKVHIVLIHTYVQNRNKTDKNTRKLDSIIECMQRDGYEIIDVKFTIYGSFTAINGPSCVILVMYK